MTDTQLETLYSQLNEYILSHFEFFWSIVFGILGIIGVALYFIARSMVEKGIEKEAEKQHKNYTDLDSKVEQIRFASRRFHPTEYELPLIDGVKRAGKCCYSKNSDDLVVVTFSVAPAEGSFPSGSNSIALLPVGFRPDGVVSQTLSDSLSVSVEQNGTILYDATTSFKEISCASIIFYAAKE